MLRYTVLLQRNKDVPGYWVMVPELPGCFSQGHTVEEALDRVKEAIQCHLEAMADDAEELPVEEDPFMMISVEVERPAVFEEGNVAPDHARFVMNNRWYSLTRKQVIEGVERARTVPVPNEKRLWYVRVEGKELPVRWFMQELLGVGAVDVVMGKCIDIFKHLGFEVLYKGKKQLTWQKRRSA